VKKATLFIHGKKVTSGMKQQLSSQLSDGKLKDYIIDKEKWKQYTFDSVAWREYDTAFKRLSKNRQVNISKTCFNMWHTGGGYEVLWREQIIVYVQHTIGRLYTHIDVPVNQSVYEPVIIIGIAEESNETLETAKQLLDCNGESFTRIHTQSKRWGDKCTIPPKV
jgi:hypothetical protein